MLFAALKMGRSAGCLLAAGLVLAGCRSPQAGERPFAAVDISGQSPAQIRQVTRAVFEAHGYAAAPGPKSLVFERPASTMSNLAYGGWDLNSVMVRVEVRVTELGENAHRLSCEAYRVRDAGDRLLEETQRLKRFSRGPYQKLLEAIQDRLAGTP